MLNYKNLPASTYFFLSFTNQYIPSFQESSIFKNEEILSPNHLPELLPHRENQIKLLANNLLPASKGRKTQNVFIYGFPGTGKTASIKYVFREFKDYSGIKTVYINCWDYKTATAVLSKIANVKDPHDRIIIATARLLNAKVITKDDKIKDSKLVEILW